MTVLERACNNLSCTIKHNVKGISEEKFQIINYGLYVFFSDVIKSLITFSIAYFLGILEYTVISLLSGGILRIYAGGVHSKSFLGCLITNTCVLFTNVYIAMLISNFNLKNIYIALFLISFIILYLYVPSDHENKPVVGKKHIRRLRIISFSIFFFEYALAVIVLPEIIANIIFVSIFSVSLTLLPITYKITGNKHGDIRTFK